MRKITNKELEDIVNKIEREALSSSRMLGWILLSATLTVGCIFYILY